MDDDNVNGGPASPKCGEMLGFVELTSGPFPTVFVATRKHESNRD